MPQITLCKHDLDTKKAAINIAALMNVLAISRGRKQRDRRLLHRPNHPNRLHHLQ